mgnify:CR=1 FL=1
MSKLQIMIIVTVFMPLLPVVLICIFSKGDKKPR